MSYSPATVPAVDPITGDVYAVCVGCFVAVPAATGACEGCAS